MLVIILLSGCTVEKPTASANDAGQQDQSTSTASGSASATTTTGAPGGEVPGSNQAPTARLNATASNGTAPLNVTFTVDGMDPDGDALTWTLTAGNDTLGNGTSLPANVTHSFEAGNYTIVLTVRDGMANASANVTLVVEEGASEPAPPAGPTEDEWATFNPDGTCDAKGEILIAGTLYLHERGNPPGTGFVAGDGTWVYEETNGLAGLQLGGPDDSTYSHCANPDLLIF